MQHGEPLRAAAHKIKMPLLPSPERVFIHGCERPPAGAHSAVPAFAGKGQRRAENLGFSAGEQIVEHIGGDAPAARPMRIHFPYKPNAALCYGVREIPIHRDLDKRSARLQQPL